MCVTLNTKRSLFLTSTRSKENKMLEEFNQVQSDVHLYEDFISSSMYLQDFDEIFQPKHLGVITQDIIDNIKETN